MTEQALRTVLRGPADADHFRVKVGRYGDRWYADPLPACDIAPATDDSWPSVSIVKKASGSDWTFVALKRVAMADLSGIDALPYDERYERLKSMNKLGLARAAERGTNVHKYFEEGLYYGGDITGPLVDDEPGADYLPAVRAFFDTYQPELVAAEMVCINRTLGYGGTADALIKIDGKTYWVDWKSRGEDSAHGAYPEEAAQVAAGACADYMIVEGPDGPMRARIPELDGGLIVSIKPDGCRIYPVDLKLGFVHWTALHDWWLDRRDERASIGKPWAPRKAKVDDGSLSQRSVEERGGGAEATTPTIATVERVATVSAPVAEGSVGSAPLTIATVEQHPPAAPVAQEAGGQAQPPASDHLIERIKKLDEKGRAVLAQQWPDSVPTFKQSSEHTAEQLHFIKLAIIKAEAEVDAPFVADPVALERSKAEHPSRFRREHTPADAFDGLSGQAWDEGGEVSQEDCDGLKVLLDAYSGISVTVWAKQCHRDGNRSLSLKQKRTRWRYSVVSALLHCARAGVDDDGLRELCYGATGLYDPCLMLGIPLGKVIASLTIAEADRLGHLARHIGTPDLVMTWNEAGEPEFSGAAWQPPDAA